MAPITSSKDFKYSLHCLNCVYEDLGYNGSMQCLPRTKQCQPIYPYDWMINSQIRKNDVIIKQGTSDQGKNKTLAQMYDN